MAYKQLLELARKSLVSNFRDLSFPMKFSFVLTYRCNAKCSMCNIWKKKITDELSIDEIEKFFAHSNKFSWMDISGGEVFLRDDVVDVVKSAAFNCRSLYLLHFATNGLLPEKIVPAMEKITQLKIPRILMTVSLDGYKELHDKIRGVPGAFDRAIRTYKELRKLSGPSFKVFIGMTLIEDNFLKTEKSFQYFKEEVPDLTYDDLHINIAQKSAHYYDNAGITLPDLRALHGIIDSISKKKKAHGISPVAYLENAYLKGAKVFLKTNRCPEKCQSLSVSCFVDPSGDVYACNTYSKVIGNIKDYDYNLKKLLASQNARKLRAEIERGACPQCWTPCEAYQTIIANFLKLRKLRK